MSLHGGMGSGLSDWQGELYSQACTTGLVLYCLAGMSSLNVLISGFAASRLLNWQCKPSAQSLNQQHPLYTASTQSRCTKWPAPCRFVCKRAFSFQPKPYARWLQAIC